MELDIVFAALARSAFRRRFHLQGRERAYLETWGIEKVLRHAREIIEQRVAAAEPKNDGRQTPWRNHPVFVAQHATATCCRGCLEKTHGIPRGARLTSGEVDYIVTVLARWLSDELREEQPVRSAGRGDADVV